MNLGMWIVWVTAAYLLSNAGNSMSVSHVVIAVTPAILVGLLAVARGGMEGEEQA